MPTCGGKRAREKLAEGELQFRGCSVACNTRTFSTSGKPGPENTENTADAYQRRTISLAVDGSIVENAQSPELATVIAGQVARAAAIFRIDEIVVFDSTPGDRNDAEATTSKAKCGPKFLARVLQYLETPQYLRRCASVISVEVHWVGPGIGLV